MRPISEPHEPDSEFIQDLARIFFEARKERLHFLIDLHSIEEDRHFLSEVVLPENQVWVVEIGGKLTGFVAFVKDWVNHLYVTPEFQNQGIGTQLLKIAKESSSALQLWVFEVNEPAIQFYGRHGFRIIERTDGATNEANMPDVRMEWMAVEANRAGEA